MEYDRFEERLLVEMARRVGTPETFPELERILPFEEQEPSNQIRELVYHLDRMKEASFLSMQEDWFEAGESVSFKYLNAALSIDWRKISMTETGLELGLQLGESRWEHLKTSSGFKVITHAAAFALGMAVGYGVFYLLSKGVI